ncbi:MAG: hypothetical protein IKF44_00250, partial [Mycoplasmataceae bacterium]|nr:hypothetical protein [Mycoplasmataceae bacterium]
YMYTIDALETLEIQLGEIEFLIKEICQDPRIQLDKKEIRDIKDIKRWIKLVLKSVKSTIKRKKMQY